MQWQQVRAQYPHQWLLLESLKAHSESGERAFENLIVLSQHADAQAAWNAYAVLRKDSPGREIFVLHTANPNYADLETLKMKELTWMGFRATQ